MNRIINVFLIFFAITPFQTFAESAPHSKKVSNEIRFVQIAAKDKYQRTELGNLGMSVEFVRSDSAWGFATERALKKIKQNGFKILGNFEKERGQGGHDGISDFPAGDEKFHNYKEFTQALQELANKHKDISQMSSIGKSTENRDIWALHINTNAKALQEGVSGKPGVLFMGNHHAREHLSLEVPLMLATYLLENRADPKIAALLDTRDIWLVPMVNPDGVEYDVSTGTYKWWRKNRRNNQDGTFGVDLNRNYGYQWGTGGSTDETDSDIYMGKKPFSEPETQAIKDFIDTRLNLKVALSFHTYSELILYPWGHTYNDVSNTKDHAVFKTMAETMSKWNGYKPQQASDLYIASGITDDWAYGTHGIFTFTFELSPSGFGGGGFYPGAKVIDKVFNANLKPCLYMMEVANDPYKVIGSNIYE